MHTNDNKLVNVQFLRFIAAALIVLLHGSDTLHSLGSDNPFFHAPRSFGFAGVEVFFLISGFIMCYTTRGERNAQKNLAFIYNRLTRIFLGYWPFFFLALLVGYSFNTNFFQHHDFIKSFLLLPGRQADRLLDVSWTLSFELYFYILFFFLLFLPASSRFRLILFISISLITFNIFAHYKLDAYSYNGYHNIGFYERFFTSLWLLEFFAGAFVAWLIEKNINAFAKTAITAGIIIAATAAYLNATLMNLEMAKFYNFQWRFLFFVSSATLILYGLVSLENKGIVIAKKWSILLGGASYSLYLLHTLVFSVMKYSGFNHWVKAGGMNAELAYILSLVFITLVSVAIYVFLEKPVYLWAKRVNPFNQSH